MRSLALLLALALPAQGQGALDYERAVLDALRVHGCTFDLSAEDGRRQFARQVAPRLGIKALELTDRRGPHYRPLSEVIADLSERGLVEVAEGGAGLSLTDCPL